MQYRENRGLPVPAAITCIESSYTLIEYVLGLILSSVLSVFSVVKVY